MVSADKKYLEKNKVLLKRYHQKMYEIISKDQNGGIEASLSLAENNIPNIRVLTPGNESVFIHDGENPGCEAKDFLSIVPEQSTGVVIMFGLGLGYSVVELLKKRKKLQKIIVFELNVEFFRLAMEYVDLSGILSDNRVILSLGEPDDLPDFLSPVNRAFMLEDIHSLNLQTCFKVNKNYEDLSSQVFDHINTFNVEGATKTIHGKKFFENRLRHLTSMHHDNKLENLKDKFKGVPAFMVAAGPSLDKNIDQIKKAAGKSVIICVDTVLPSLLKHDITPDFVTSIDYLDMTYEKIADTAQDSKVRNINLICTSWISDTVTKQFPVNDVFWAFSNNALENWMNICLGGNMAIGGAGTVAHLNFVSAQIMGCDPLVFVGQDLAFSGNTRHSADVVLGANEKMQRLLANKKDLVWVKGVKESKLPTSRNMHNYLKTFEKMIEESDRKVINATEGGAFINGAEHISLARVIDTYCSNTIIANRQSDQKKIDLKKSMDSALKEVGKLEKIINKAEKLSALVLNELKKLKRTRKRYHNVSMLPGKLQKKIITLDNCHKSADQNKIWELFDEMTMEGLRQNERQRLDIEKLEGVPAKYLEWLLKTIERIDKVNKIRIENLTMFKTQLEYLISYYLDETALLEKTQKEPHDVGDILALAALYEESGDLVLLEKMLNRHGSKLGEDAGFYYYDGLIALHQGGYEKAEQNFKLSDNLDKTFSRKIINCRNAIAEYYFQQGLSIISGRLAGFDKKVGMNMFLKSIKCFSGHSELVKQLRTMAENDLKRIKQNIETHGNKVLNDNKNVLKTWVDFVSGEEKIKEIITKEITADFFLFYGKVLLDEKEFQQALENYEKALKFLPDNPDLYIAVADTYFLMGEFDEGLQYLQHAVSLDKKYAVYWNNMGNNLKNQGDLKGAVVAFEQYFQAVPDNLEVLKKMHECFFALGDKDSTERIIQRLEKLRSIGIDGGSNEN